MTAAEASYKELHTLIQSRRSRSAQPRPPLPLPREHLEMSGAESMMGAPELVAYQSLLSTFAQLHHTCSSRINWLEEEVSAHQSHVTALRRELQDKFPSADPVPLSDWSKEPSVSLSSAPSADLSEPPKTKATKAAKNRGGRRRTGSEERDVVSVTLPARMSKTQG
ncbi:coiled-coil domain-containing protein 171, partial [Larimichthys crocea]|uniref:coiled-coil domain-containing protein 171 n=1 Tax=Larimichthys crocea TaxID=215358 RepID=UPI000F5F3142